MVKGLTVPPPGIHVFHACWSRFLGTWPDIDDPARVCIYADGKARLTHHHLGACIGDMQVLVTNSVYFAADGPVVEWDEDCSNVRAGPNAIHYEAARKDCGAHLLYNAFWKLKNFCVQQMLPRDIIHAIDLGTIVRLILAILMKYFECVEKILGMEGLAASRMGARLLILHII